MQNILLPADKIWIDESLIAYRIRPTNDIPRHAKNEFVVVTEEPRGDKTHRLIAGSRRFARQCVENTQPQIECLLSQETDEYTIKLIQLADAIDKEGLTHLEIARGIKATFTRKETPEQIAATLNRRKWKIVVWQKVYGLPESIQMIIEANDDCLTEDDIKIITQIERSSIPHYLRLCTAQPLRTKSVGPRRTSQDIIKMMQHTLQVCGGNNIIARVLMWCLCNLSNEQLEADIRDEQHRLSLTRDQH